MPNCELCGKDVENLTTTKVSGAELDVCSDCTQHGTTLDSGSSDSETSTKYSTSSQDSSQSRGNPQRRNTTGGGRGSDYEDRTDGYDDLSELALNFGEKIQDARNREGMNRDELAKELGIKSSHLRNIENEKTQPSVELQQRIERELGIDLTMGDVDY